MTPATPPALHDTPRRLLAAAALAAGCALAASTARAQQTPPPDTSSGAQPAGSPSDDALEALLRHGVELRQQGHDDLALEEFRRAYEASHSPRALAQMGLAEQALGRWLEADAHLHQALASSSDPWIAQHRAALEQSVEQIAQHIGQVDVVSSVQGARVSVNREPVGRTPLATPLRLVAGTATVEVSAPGFIPMNRTVVVLAGGRSRESFDLVPVQGPGGGVEGGEVGAPHVRAHAREARISPLVWVGGGAAVAGGVAALVLGLAGATIQSDYLAHCNAGGALAGDCAQRMATQQGQLDGIAEGVNVLLGVAGAGLAALVVGLVVSDYGGGGGGSSEHAASASQRRRARATIAPSRGGLGVSW